jgi:hypothetical protein
MGNQQHRLCTDLLWSDKFSGVLLNWVPGEVDWAILHGAVCYCHPNRHNSNPLCLDSRPSQQFRGLLYHLRSVGCHRCRLAGTNERWVFLLRITMISAPLAEGLNGFSAFVDAYERIKKGPTKLALTHSPTYSNSLRWTLISPNPCFWVRDTVKIGEGIRFSSYFQVLQLHSLMVWLRHCPH